MFSVTNKFYTSFVKFGGSIGYQFRKRYVTNVGNWKKEKKVCFHWKTDTKISFFRQKNKTVLLIVNHTVFDKVT